MKSIRQRIMALSVSCALAVSLAGCGVNVTGVALNPPGQHGKRLYHYRHAGIRL